MEVSGTAEEQQNVRPPSIADHEDFTKMALESDDLAALVGERGECVFNWTTRDGYPIGVVMAYVYRYGSFWANCTEHRNRVAALRARPQASVVISNDAKMATYKGDAVIHTPMDADWARVKGWFYAALAGTEHDPANPFLRRLESFLDSPRQVIIQLPADLVPLCVNLQ